MVMVLFSRVAPCALVVAMVIGLLGGCGESRSIFGGCTARDEQLSTTLAGLPILKAHPVSAEPTTQISGCDTDDGFAFAEHEYHTELDRQDVIAFYRKAATDDGWLPDGENPAPPTDGLVITAAVACFLKLVDGTTVHFKVWFPSDLRIPGELGPTTLGDYGVGVTGSHDGTAWC
jgi:hypothetical protein